MKGERSGMARFLSRWPLSPGPRGRVDRVDEAVGRIRVMAGSGEQVVNAWPGRPASRLSYLGRDCDPDSDLEYPTGEPGTWDY